MPKPSIICGCVNGHLKLGKVIFIFGVQLWVRFCIEQSRCNFSVLLLLIEAKLSYLDPEMDHVQISSVLYAFMYSYISLKGFTVI
jgi:hypothetical protein